MERKQRKGKVLPEEERTVYKGLCFTEKKFHAPFGISPTEWTKRTNVLCGTW